MDNLRNRIIGSNNQDDYSSKYFTIESLVDSNTIGWKCSTSSSSYLKNIYVSTDEGVTWTLKKSSLSGTTLAVLNKNKKLMIKYCDTDTYATSASYYNYFTSTKSFDVEGNLMSLISAGDFTTAKTISKNYAFYYLFYNCTNLRRAENLILPATTLSTYCYYGMFRGCSTMTNGPKELPATTMKSNCYAYMFYGCSSLKLTPALPAKTLATYCYQYIFYNCTALTKVQDILPATTLQSHCYQYMFYGCNKITSAPILPASTLTSYCYYYMFYNCSKLNNIICLATSVSASSCKYYWTYGVASSGTFTKSPSITTSTWSRGYSGIPTNWTVNDFNGNLTNATITVEDLKYTGFPITPSVTVTMSGAVVSESFYTIAYNNNTEVGEATVTVTGTGIYSGTATGHFEIVVQQLGIVTFNSLDTVYKYESDISMTFLRTATKNGDGSLSYTSSNTSTATVSNNGTVTIIGYGTTTITAKMAETARYSAARSSYVVIVLPTFETGKTKDFDFTGTVQLAGILPGTYVYQCWGAQGGNNSTNSEYCTSEIAYGGAGGYSAYIDTSASIANRYVCVGGQNGWNCGGFPYYGSREYDGNFCYTYSGVGGGATDIASTSTTITHYDYQRDVRSSFSNRFIVAGGGSGAGCTYYSKVSPGTYTTLGTINLANSSGIFNGNSWTRDETGTSTIYLKYNFIGVSSDVSNKFIRMTIDSSHPMISLLRTNSSSSNYVDIMSLYSSTYTEEYYFAYSGQQPTLSNLRIYLTTSDVSSISGNLTIEIADGNFDTGLVYANGYAGGGNPSEGYDSSYKATNTSAGNNGSLGYGANGLGYYSDAGGGGGGYYGGGSYGYGSYGDFTISTLTEGVRLSGGGSGYISTSNKGFTISGSNSIPLKSKNYYNYYNNTGNYGNGYARITKIGDSTLNLNKPFTIEVLEDGDLYIISKLGMRSNSSSVGLSAKTFEYNKNDVGWTSFTVDAGETYTINVSKDDIIKLRGNSSYYCNKGYSRPAYININSSCKINISGNIMSLVNSTNYPYSTSIQTPYDSTNLSYHDNTVFGYLFKDSLVVDASELILPAVIIESYCYLGMFQNCIYLEKAPKLLPAPYPGHYSYAYMFDGCTSLTESPLLPSENGYSYVYSYMFRGCTSLNKIKAMFKTTDDFSSNHWTDGVASNGVFIRNINANTSSFSGVIPSGWTIINTDW